MYQRPQVTAVPTVEHPPLRLIPSRFIRQGDHPELPQPIPGLLDGYLTILAGAGGVGKTYLAEQIVRHLSSGVQLGRFPLPEVPLTSWFLVLEDVEALAQQRSLEVAKFGSLAEDQSPEDTGHDTVVYITDGGRGIVSLTERLESARAAGETLPGVIVVDYLHKLIGSQPAGLSPVAWETRQIERLREIGIEYGAHVLVLTHMTKEGKVNGTNALLNACDTMYVLALGEDRAYAALECRKMRMSPEVNYALCRKANGSWGFDAEGWASENMASGLTRDILSVLRREGPMTLGQIVSHHQVGGERAGIRTALDRARKREEVRWYRGHWHIMAGPGDQQLAAEPLRICAACSTPITLPGTERYHVTCDPAERKRRQDPATIPAPRPPDPEVTAEWETPPLPDEPGTALDSLKNSIATSRFHPLQRVPQELWQQEPWSLITELTGGEPKWCAPGWKTKRVSWDDPDGSRHHRQDLIAPPGTGGVIVTLDRNGSYPSACGSVALAPNKLVHTGPLSDTFGRAGLFLVPLPEWPEDQPHPLGRIALGVAPGDPVWITTPHLILLTRNLKLPVPILDSWTGVRNDSLLERFAKDARRVRMNRATDPAAYDAWKPTMGAALRLLWPKSERTLKNPLFYRPDWRVSLVAEASVRHWQMAIRAHNSEGEHKLVALANVDEAAFWTPGGEVPEPYVVGSKFGEVEIKRSEDGPQ